jgi:soluble lytic murein transglycosylase
VKWRRLPWIVVPLLIIIGAAGYSYRKEQLERSRDAAIQAATQRYGVEPALVKAVIWRESKFNTQARGRAGEIGLMQLREEAAQEWADAERVGGFEYEHCLDELTNTLAGTWYLKKLLKRYQQTDNPVPYALADYNAGRGNVLKWLNGAGATNSAAFLEQIAFPGTKEYVESVMQRREKYGSIFQQHTN